MNDLIRREDAIGACAYETLECYEARKAIRAIPSADLNAEFAEWARLWFKEELEADRPQGEWIDRGYRVPSEWVKKCSLCGHETDTWKWCNFCPNCGCRMKGADDE